MEITMKARSSGRVARLLVNLACLVCMLVALSFIAPAAFGYQRYVITGSSMTGTIDLGSVVFSEVVPVDELEVGDVITYLPPPESGVDDLVTHRIVSIDGDVYRTQGDANSDPDPWTFRLDQATQSRVVLDVPYVGYAFIALHDRTLRMVLIGIPAALIALASLVQLARGLRRPEEQVRVDVRDTTSVPEEASTGARTGADR
ncbi:signal peptidase I [Nocardioides taihuensis]|uniref:Signal peptidase I n=1 Tax=Nocardioides taihuensis TaxID=1835606 RepID=A0ABW0BK97_9ACTN